MYKIDYLYVNNLLPRKNLINKFLLYLKKYGILIFEYIDTNVSVDIVSSKIIN